TANRNVTVTGPVTSSGEQSDAQESQAEAPAAEHASAAKISHHPSTAGPTTIPPSGDTSLADGVITVEQPPVGSAIAAGATLRLHVKFTPKHAGAVVGTLLVHTSAGPLAVSVSGYGTAPGLVLSAPALAFRTIDTHAGGKIVSVTFSNSWDRPETLSGYQLPRGPYQVSGLPPVGSVLAPRHAVTVSVLFDPRYAGSYRSQLRIALDGRVSEIPVTGKAVAGFARLAVSAHTIDAGSVAVGSSKTLTFTVGDAGNVPLTISRAIAPLGAFYAPVPLPAGLAIEPRTRLVLKVTFHPTAVGPASGQYRFNSNAGGGYVVVNFTGRGVAR
ncbi:MAG TPA: choice-of-anchor D domain-containing protein, partial [Solirubrobacteraceae bacterium]|nr:choice-of-anchor D domain-containing protein [Solirubrobacteraceae bacterium]